MADAFTPERIAQLRKILAKHSPPAVSCAMENLPAALDEIERLSAERDSLIDQVRAMSGVSATLSRVTAERDEAVKHAENRFWHEGEPPKPWRTEWFIAETIYGDKVVLKALPEEFTYDYKTADEIYMAARNIKRWMRFPDSQFIEPEARAFLSRMEGRKDG